MTDERWRRTKALFQAAVDRPEAERAAFLAAAVGDDAALLREVESLLYSDDGDVGLLDELPIASETVLSDHFGVVSAAADIDLYAGVRVGPYEVVAPLGAGGMGEVYRARDTTLHRDVALKVLSGHVALDPDRLARFTREAQTLASLNHPNIAAIYGLEHSDRVQALVLELVEGDTLSSRLAANAGSTPPGLPIEQALDYAQQIAAALEAAHEKGITHCDLKPANIQVTPRGIVKLLDFGIAKVLTRDGRTASAIDGFIAGTPGYMSPEQASGKDVDSRTDIWAFGCLFYEMLTGTRAFHGESLSDTVAAVQERDPAWSLLPRATPRRIRVLLERCLHKDETRRLQTIADARRAIERAQHGIGRWRFAGFAAAAVLLAILGAAILTQFRAAQARWARNVAIPRIVQLVTADDYANAYEVALAVERIEPHDPMLATLWPQFSAPISLTTVPDGADVYSRPYGSGDHRWQRLGRTPLEAVRFPMGVFQFRFEKNGHDPQTIAAPNPSTLLGNATNRLATRVAIRLPLEGSAPGMVPIPGGAFPVSLNAFSTTDPIPLNPYIIDRYEVSNAQFAQFVDAGGYTDPEYWQGVPLVLGGRELPWQELVEQFRDSTGARAPSTWASGTYAAGSGDRPVGGVSWYEAVAYCRFRNKTLPTVYHWRRAALSPDEMFAPLAPATIGYSNFGQSGPAAVGTFLGVGPYGTYDMAGNVREWSWNEWQPGIRWIQGGGWSDQGHMLVVPDRAPASDRSPINGFRCVQYGSDPIPDRLLRPIARPLRNNRTANAVSDEVFEVFKKQLLPQQNVPLNARIESTDETASEWVRQKISWDAGYESARVAAYLFLPKGAKPPYQLVVYFPGRSSFIGRMPSDGLQPDFVDFVVKGGRALVWPIYKGSYERWVPTALPTVEVRRLLFDWRQDLSRVIDVMSQRSDIDTRQIAYLGLSYGASMPLPLLALEDRLKAAVLASAGLGALPGAPESDSLNYVPRITLPVLVLSGRQDFVFPLKTSAEPLFERLGTPADRKRHVIFDAGHMMFPRSAMAQEIQAWLDRYLGPTGGSSP